MSNIKLIALDIDGTIMDKEYKISERVKNAIKEATNKGIFVVLATGRMYSATVPIAESLNLSTPIIAYQGGLVMESCKKAKVLLKYSLAPEISTKILDELDKFNIQVNVYYNDELYARSENHILKEYATKRFISYHIIPSFEEIIAKHPDKILGIDENPDKMTEIRDYFREKYSQELNIMKSTPIYCEFVNKQASKRNAILFLAEKWGINKDEIMAIGDQDNDLDMLEVAGYSVAMGNAPETLKKAAKYTTQSVENDGAAIAIEEFVLQEK